MSFTLTISGLFTFGCRPGSAIGYNDHSSLVLESRRRPSSAILHQNPHVGHMFEHDVSGYVFCENVRWIIGSRDFCQGEVSTLQPVLHPQISDMQMSDFAEASASADAYGRRGIREDMNLEFNTNIFGQ